LSDFFYLRWNHHEYGPLLFSRNALAFGFFIAMIRKTLLLMMMQFERQQHVLAKLVNLMRTADQSLAGFPG
jgi:hypothetical protein